MLIHVYQKMLDVRIEHKKEPDDIKWVSAMEGEVERPLKIYVAGPYTADTPADVDRNVRTAMDVGVALFHKGHFPFIPHLTHYVDGRANETNRRLTWDDYMRRDLAWLEVADAFFFIKESKGAVIELEAARAAGLDIYYSLGEVPTVQGNHYKSVGAKKQV
jgi:hypothetical protein